MPVISENRYAPPLPKAKEGGFSSRMGSGCSDCKRLVMGLWGILSALVAAGTSASCSFHVGMFGGVGGYGREEAADDDEARGERERAGVVLRGVGDEDAGEREGEARGIVEME